MFSRNLESVLSSSSWTGRDRLGPLTLQLGMCKRPPTWGPFDARWPRLHPQIWAKCLHREHAEACSLVVCVSVWSVTQLCLTLCDPMDCSPPGSSVHGILQARTLEWMAIPFSRGSSQLRDWAWVAVLPALQADSLPWASSPAACAQNADCCTFSSHLSPHSSYSPRLQPPHFFFLHHMNTQSPWLGEAELSLAWLPCE